MKRKIALTLTLLGLGLGMLASASAQNGKGADWKGLAEAARRGSSSADASVAARVDEAYAEKTKSRAVVAETESATDLTGTWFVTVPGPTPAENFYAYHTFAGGGTFVETSSLLVTLTEGPAHGVWERSRRGFILTFELFAFDPENRVQAGRVRVRNFIRMTDPNNFTSDSAVDFIELDGTVIPNIATATFTGERVRLRGLN